MVVTNMMMSPQQNKRILFLRHLFRNWSLLKYIFSGRIVYKYVLSESVGNSGCELTVFRYLVEEASKRVSRVRWPERSITLVFFSFLLFLIITRICRIISFILRLGVGQPLTLIRRIIPWFICIW